VDQPGLLRGRCPVARQTWRRIERRRHVVSWVATELAALQVDGSGVPSACRLVRSDTMRSSTSVIQASASTSFSCAVSGFSGVLADMARQQPRGPKLVRISQIFVLLAGQRHKPRLGIIGDLRCLDGTRAVIEYRHRTKTHRAMQAPLHGLMGHADRLAHYKA
jgi:hypothetical protein